MGGGGPQSSSRQTLLWSSLWFSVSKGRSGCSFSAPVTGFIALFILTNESTLQTSLLGSPHYPCWGGGAAVLLEGRKLRRPHPRGPRRQGGGWGEPRVEPWWCGCLPLGPWLLFIGGKGDFITIEELYSQQGSLASLQWWSMGTWNPPVSGSGWHAALGELAPALCWRCSLITAPECAQSLSLGKNLVLLPSGLGPGSLSVLSQGKVELAHGHTASSFPDSALNPCEPVSSSPWSP